MSTFPFTVVVFLKVRQLVSEHSLLKVVFVFLIFFSTTAFPQHFLSFHNLSPYPPSPTVPRPLLPRLLTLQATLLMLYICSWPESAICLSTCR